MTSGGYSIASMTAVHAIDGLQRLYRRDLRTIQARIADGQSFEHDARLVAHMERRIAELDAARDACRLK
jgi:hypothetical protein